MQAEEQNGSGRLASEQRFSSAGEGDSPFRELFENVPSGIAIYRELDEGRDFQFVDFNSAAERIDRICRSEVLGRRVTEVFPSVKEFGLLSVLQRVWRTGKTEHHPVNFYLDGRIAGWRDNRVLRLPGGEVVAIYEDLTPLRRAEDRFRATFEQAAVGMAHIGLDGRFLELNEKLCELTGYSRPELQSRRFQDITHPEDLEADLALARDLWAGRIPHYRIEKRYVRKDGSMLWINLTASAVRDAQGQPAYGIAVIEDISLRREAQALRANEELQRMALSAANAGAWQYDFRTGRQLWSPESYEIFGIDPGERPPDFKEWLLRCVHHEDRILFDRAVAEAAKSGASEFRIEFRSSHPREGLRWVMSLGRLVCDERNRLLRAFGLNFDITERKAAEEHRALLTSELNHRVKNLFATVRAMFSQTLATAGSLESFADAFSSRVNALAGGNELLIRSDWQPVALAELLHSVAESFGPNIRIASRPEGARLSPKSALALNLILHELATNATKYGALSVPDGTVEIECSPGDEVGVMTCRWTEKGGPRVSAPRSKGFGSVLIERSAKYDLNGEATIAYAPEGVRCTIWIRIEE